MCNQYYCAVKDILMIQNQENVNPFTKADLMTIDMKKLSVIVIGRKERNKKLILMRDLIENFIPTR